jgi:hypothetical protein
VTAFPLPPQDRSKIGCHYYAGTDKDGPWQLILTKTFHPVATDHPDTGVEPTEPGYNAPVTSEEKVHE